MADRIVVMDAGRIAQVGTPEEVYDRPASPFVASFMGAENTIALEVERADGGRGSSAGSACRASLGPRGHASGRAGHRLFPRRRCRASMRPMRRRPTIAIVCPAGLPPRAYPGGITATGSRPAAVSSRVDDDRLPRARNASVGLRICRCAPPHLPGIRSQYRRLTRIKTHAHPHDCLLARRSDGGSPLSAQTLNVATAGDQNMVDYVKDYLGPMFEKSHPGVKVVAVGTGPGDAGSQKIFEKLDAQKNAGAPTSDFDVVVDPPEGRRHDGQGRPAAKVPRQARRPATLVTRDTADERARRRCRRAT